MSITVKELVGVLGLEVDERSFVVAEELMGFAKVGMLAIGAAAGVAAMALAAAVVKTAEYADQVEKAAQRTGIGVEALQALQYAAERADVGAEGLQAALNFMAKRGVKDFEAELRRAADELAAMPDGGAKAARAMQLFGKQGAALIPMLNEGSAGLDEMTTKAREMGLVLGEDAVEQGAALKDSLEDLQGFISGMARSIAGPLLKPAREWLGRLLEWVRANRSIIAQKIDQVFTVIGKALGFVVRLAEPVVDIIWRLVEAVAASKVALMALAGVGIALALPWLAPVAAIGLFLMALEEVWGWVTGKRDTLLEDALGPFEQFKSMLDVDNPEDTGLVVAAKLVGRALREALETAQKIRDFIEHPFGGSGPGGASDGSLGDRVRESAGQGAKGYAGLLGSFWGRAMHWDWLAAQGDRAAGRNFGDLLLTDAGKEAYGWNAAFAPQAPAAAPSGQQTTIGSITVHAPPGSTAQDVVDLIRQQIGIERRTEYVSALPAVQR